MLKMLSPVVQPLRPIKRGKRVRKKLRLSSVGTGKDTEQATEESQLLPGNWM